MVVKNIVEVITVVGKYPGEVGEKKKWIKQYEEVCPCMIRISIK